MLLGRIESAIRDRTDRRCFYGKHRKCAKFASIERYRYMVVRHGKINRAIVEAPGPQFNTNSIFSTIARELHT